MMEDRNRQKWREKSRKNTEDYDANIPFKFFPVKGKTKLQ